MKIDAYKKYVIVNILFPRHENIVDGTMVIICWCGHADKYHITGIPNKCIKCDTCKYFRPRGKASPDTENPILARFDGICKICSNPIKSKKDKIIRINNVWIHESCSGVK